LSKHTVAIIQARMGSIRFPGKMLATLGGHSLLEWVLYRVGRATRLDDIILATSVHSRDDPLADTADNLGVRVLRGDELDVLDRFVTAADSTGAERVVRICADNPFVDPCEIDRLIDYFSKSDSDYACNHLDRLGSRYADGFGAEILDTHLLRQVATMATEEKHREHVTLYLWDNMERYSLTAIPAPPSLSFPELVFDVDVPDGLIRLEKLIKAGVNLDSTAERIVELAISQAR